ncbi:MAG: 5-formyltetrahydrofolate cyclo-ligase [Hadesarchaea archaeon]|nr:MAG: 5-formyltetrahydrofolate cyclo-ligase [Hadesarchaea archaeon]
MDKQAIREMIWQKMESRGVATFPKPIQGRIPNFKGSVEAAVRLRLLSIYKSAGTIFVNPDAPQLPVREMALNDGKCVVMATPKLREGFLVLDPVKIRNVRRAASIRGAFKHGERVDVPRLKIDLIVEGSVAVDKRGGRVGKGSGFGDLEIAILREMGVIDDRTPIVTTVHSLQILNEVPMDEHDVPVDFLVTPEQTIETEHSFPKPSGIIWELFAGDEFKQIPVLAELRGRK